MKDNTDIKLPFISKFAYGMGDVGCNFSWMFVGNFLMIFYSDVIGISMSAVAGLMLFSRFCDAINDPIVGGLTDRTKSRWGRYRPWLLIAAPITAMVLMATFWAHPDWSNTAKIIYMSVTYCILVLGYTCVNIPYGTLCGAMTQNIEERAKINTFRSVSAMIAIGIINIITLPLISKLGGGNDKQGYLLVAVVYGIIFALCHIFCFAKTKEAVTVPEKEKITLKLQLKTVIQNKPYLLALLGQFLFGVTLYGRNADALYYFKYVEGSEAFFTKYSMAIIIPSIIGAGLFPIIFKWTGNKGRAASILALGTGVCMISLYLFSPVSSPAAFYICSGLTQFFYAQEVKIAAVTLGKNGAYVRTAEGGTLVSGFKNKAIDDHIALNVRSVDEAFKFVNESGLNNTKDSIHFLPFWENGVKFFTIEGPNKEKIEFSQYL